MGITERREREKDQRRNDIIDAAEKVFFSKGLEHATMDDVAEGAELSKGTLYLYFNSKEELYLSIHLRGNRILKGMFEQAVAKHTTGIEKTRAIGLAYFDFFYRYPDYFNALIYYESHHILSANDDSVAAACLREGKTTLDILVQSIITGINDGSMRKNIDPLKTAISLWGQSTGIIQLVAMRKNLFQGQYALSVKDIITYTFDLIYHSLKP
jgi:TetR/AcrR family transcriptional regulator